MGELPCRLLLGVLMLSWRGTPRWIGIYFWKPSGELFLYRRQFLLCGKVSPFVGIFPQIVKLLRPLIIPNVAITICSNGMIVFTMGGKSGPLPLSVRIHEKRGKACSLKALSFGQAAEVDKGGVDAEKLCRAGATRSPAHSRCRDDEGHSGSAFPERLLGPPLFFSKEEPMV